MTDPHVSPRRAARAAAQAALEQQAHALPRHAARPRAARRMRGAFVVSAVLALLVGGPVALAAAVRGPELASAAAPLTEKTAEPELRVRIAPMPEEGLPAPTMSVQAAGSSLCDDPAFSAALSGGDDAGAIAAAGGAAALRTAVATGAAPCVPLDDPARVWVVVNKARPYVPVDYAPADLVAPDIRVLDDVTLRRPAADALSALARDAEAQGAGQIAAESAYRSYATQQSTYAGHVSDRGVAGADLVSARPGYSEHQSGLAVDVVPCDGSCASIDDLAASAQGAWIAEHAWEYGWIVRYDAGRTPVTGYEPEPWHLRFIGTDLARAYHEGGWTTLEEFFALPPAPTY